MAYGYNELVKKKKKLVTADDVLKQPTQPLRPAITPPSVLPQAPVAPTLNAPPPTQTQPNIAQAIPPPQQAESDLAAMMAQLQGQVTPEGGNDPAALKAQLQQQLQQAEGQGNNTLADQLRAKIAAMAGGQPSQQAGTSTGVQPTPPPVSPLPTDTSQTQQQTQDRIAAIDQTLANLPTGPGSEELRTRLMEEKANLQRQTVEQQGTSGMTREQLQARRDTAQQAIDLSTGGQGLEWARQQFPEFYGLPDAEVEKRLREYVGDYENQYENWGAKLDESTQQLVDLLNEQGMNIKDPASVQNNPRFQAAIEALKQGEDINEVAAQLRQGLPEGYDFTTGEAGYDPSKGTLPDWMQTNIPDIERGADINVGQTTIDPSTLNQLITSITGSKATETQLNELMKIISRGAEVTPEEVAKVTEQFGAGADKQSKREEQEALANMLGALSARGAGTNLSAVTGGAANLAGRFQEEREKRRGEMARDVYGRLITERGATTREALGQLGGIAERETAARLKAGEIISGEKIAGAKIGSEEKMKQADLQLAQDTLYQEGKLTQAGLELKQNLEQAGLNLEKYKTDQGYDLEMARQDLTERLTQSGLDVEAAKLQADNYFKSIDAALEDKKINTMVDQSVAELELRASQGDQDAAIQVEGLRLTQEIQRYGIRANIATDLADLYYKLKSGKEQMDLTKWMFLKELDLKLREAGKGDGIGGFLGGLVGTAVGSLAGGVGAAAGGAAGRAIFGG